MEQVNVVLEYNAAFQCHLRIQLIKSHSSKLKENMLNFLQEYGKSYYKNHIIIDNNMPCSCHK